MIDQTRKTHKNSLFFNAGDEFQGTLFYTLYKGEKTAETLNQLGFDAMTLVSCFSARVERVPVLIDV